MRSQQNGSVRRWWVLAVLGLAQLMVVLDSTIVNVALPDAQRDLGFSTADRQWVVTAYALAFGSLLLLGGRLSDRWGQRTTLVVGLVGFALASAAGGAAPSFEVLVAARAVQGAFAAILAPATLSLLTTTFTEPGERARAFGIFGAVSGAGAGVGLLLGGALTQYLGWAWCLYVNDVLAVAALAGTLALIPRREPQRAEPLDLPGTLTVVAGLAALVYGLSTAETDGWTSPLTLGLIAAGLALLAVFVAVERRADHPLLPLRVVLDRRRGGALIAASLSAVGLFAALLFLTFFLQQQLGFSPLLTGAAFLPMIAAITLTATAVGPRMLTAGGPRLPIVTGALLGTVGLGLLWRLDAGSGYAAGVLPGTVVLGLGMGMIFGSAIDAATDGVLPADAGIASAMPNTGQQVFGALGTALLSSLAAQAGASALAAGATSAAAAVAGYGRAFLVGGAVFALMALLTWLVLPSGSATAAAAPGRRPPDGSDVSDSPDDTPDRTTTGATR